MPRITPTGWKTLLTVFGLHGCQYERKKGSHHILICPNEKRVVVTPECEQIDIDIIKNSVRTAGMTREEYFDLPKQG